MLANIQVSIKAFEVESYYPARWFVKIIECLLQRATRFPFFSCQQRIRQGIIVIVPCPLGFFLMLLKVERGERGGGVIRQTREISRKCTLVKKLSFSISDDLETQR